MGPKERLKFFLAPTGLHMANLRRRHLRLEPELGLLPALVARHRVALDVGANKGVYTHALLRLAAAVHAFEPNPELAPWLSRLRRPRLTIHPVALGDRDGEGTLRIPVGRGGRPSRQGATLATTGRVRRGFVEKRTPVRRLDSLDLGDVGFIKIDAEGFEAEVIAGARETLARCRPVMLIEIEEAHTGEPPALSIGRIESLGYACYALAGGVLTDARLIDLDRAHVFNWIFLPRPMSGDPRATSAERDAPVRSSGRNPRGRVKPPVAAGSTAAEPPG